MQGEVAAGILEFYIGEGDVADDGVNGALGQARIAEGFNADVMSRVEHAGDPSGEAIQLHADEAHPLRGQRNEVADPAAWLQDGCLRRHTQALEGLVHGTDNEG